MKSISRIFFVIIWISRKIEYTSMYYLLFLLIFLHFYLQISLCKTPFCTISTMFVTCVRFELGTPDDMAAMLWFTWPPWVKWPKPWTSRDWLPKVTNMPRSMSFWLATRLSRTSKFFLSLYLFSWKSNKKTPIDFFFILLRSIVFSWNHLKQEVLHITKKSPKKCNLTWF